MSFEQELTNVKPGVPGGAGIARESLSAHMPSAADRKSVRINTAKKGFSKYISPRVELIIGVFALIMILSPALLFSIALSVPYYTLTPSNCNSTFIGNPQWGLNPSPIPPQVYYTSEMNIKSLKDQLDWLVNNPWTVFLGKGVCPNGKSASWPSYCLSYGDAGVPSVWEMIDLQNQQGTAAIQPLYSDMVTGASKMKQAFGISVIGCVVSWILILYSIYDGIYTDIEDGSAGLNLAEEVTSKSNEDVRATFSATDNPEANEVAVNTAAALVEKHIDDPVFKQLNVHALHRMVQQEEKPLVITYTHSIAVELASFMVLFALAISTLLSLEQSEVVTVGVDGPWSGFFVSCTVNVTPGAGPGIVYYQCVSMGIYVFLLVLCELYYISEYFTQCMHNIMTHPDEQTLIELHHEKTGASKKIVIWTGPVFLSRIHLTKVRAIQRIYEAMFGARYVQEKHAHLDPWVAPRTEAAERTLEDIRSEIARKKAAANKSVPLAEQATDIKAAPQKKKEFVL